MLNRLTAACVLTFAIPFAAAAQVGVYPQQQAPYPQPYPQPGGQPQPYPGGQPPPYPQPGGQPPPYPQPYPQPGAAVPPGYGPQGLVPPGYPGVYGPAEPLVSSVEGLVQFSLGTYFVRYTASSQSFAGNGGDFSRSDLSWGFSSSSPVLLEGGYGILNNLVVGGVLQIGGVSGSSTAKLGGAMTSSSAFDLLIAPKADYQFMPTSKINPFVGGMLGVEIVSASTTPPAMPATVDSQTHFTLLARGGVRIFVFDGFSVDPALVIGFRLGSGSTSPAGASAVDYGVSGFRVGLSVSMSGWLRL